MTRSPANIHRQGVRLVFLGSLFFAAGAFAAPDEAALGQAEGYPNCPASLRPDTRCLVGLVSRFDEVFPARKVAKGAKERPLKRAATELRSATGTSRRTAGWTTICRATAPRGC